MDRESRLDYLRRLEKLARREGIEEHVCARSLIRSAKAEKRHVGTYLFRPARPFFAGLYIAVNLLLTLLLSLGVGLSLDSGAAALLLLLPVSELVKRVLDTLLLRLLPPRRLPRLDLSGGVPAEGRTLCVVSTLLDSEREAHDAARRLEELRFACRREGKSLRFGLLADLPEADSAETEADAAVLAAAVEEIHRLNRQHGGGFYLFTRPRRFDGERWSGRERKRGALLELARLLSDRESELSVTGDRDALAGTRFLLTFDSDTRLYPGAAGELIGAMLHPLNSPKLDAEKGIVTAGYGILQPRLETELQSANASDFSLVFAGPGGSDPYGSGCGELYMDAFGRSGFAGKGLVDLRALLLCSERHIPEGRVLSHDAPEGALLRGGFVGDAALSDRFPARPLAYYKRLHRWVRGDWQNLPFLFSPALCAVDRWRLFDSLRRSLLPPMTLLAILAGFLLPGHPLAISAAAALLALTGRIFRTLAEAGLSRPQRPRPRHYARVLTGIGGAIVQCFLRLWLLPYESWICLTALLTALWRMGVSHRRLLQWQTAAQAEQSGRGLSDHVRAFWQSELLGLALLLFSPVVMGCSAGLVWLLSPLCAWALGLPAVQESSLSRADRAWLRQASADSFRYFTANCTAEDNYLPPDNVQEQPPTGAAHRTSPTNIGLCLLSFAAARDLELLPREELPGCVARMLDTLERMPRYRGHFYNWYDTRTLTPLPPAMLSTVDSGNLCAALTALRQALLEYGEAALARRVETLCGAMDFSLLYDRDRGLFYISFDPETGRGLGGWYDLMASEAMLTSYLAIARGEAPVRHWRRLSRAQLQKDGFRGLASWTGTMFEYLMPALFLPYERGSLLSESARFCVYAQRRQVFAGKPWGISESAFYSLDAALNYRYKASGCAALALRRGQEADMVVAPYASFLALAVNAPAAVRNLRRLERFGARGRFGFYEALDFTPARCRRDEGELVACCMAHHVGMSVLAAANTLCEGSILRRFLADPAMGACRLLLEERIPEGGAVLRRELSRAQERPPRRAQEGWQLRGNRADAPAACLLSNGVWHLRAESGGALRAVCGELLIYEKPELRLGGLSLLPAANAELWAFSEEQAAWEYRSGEAEATLRLGTAAGQTGERWELSLRSLRQETTELALALPLRLCHARDWKAHPAFWALGIVPEERENALLLHRLPRGGCPGLWLCLRVDREARPSFDTPLLRLTLPISPRRGAVETVKLALCAGTDADAAYAGAGLILQSEARGRMVSAAAGRLGMNGAEIGAAMALLRGLQRLLSGAAPKSALWPYGLSGELPLLCCRSDAKEALPLLRRFLLLKSCGAEAELVYLSDELGEYRRPLQSLIRRELAGLGLEALLSSRGGVHFAPLAAAREIESRAIWIAGGSKRDAKPLCTPILSAPRGGMLPMYEWEHGAFRFSVLDTLPPRLWQLPLVGGRLGAILTECGPAALWCENAREMRLVEPVEDIRSVEAALPLWAETAEGPFSLFAANDGHACRVRFGRGWAEYEKTLRDRRLRTTVFAADDTLILRIEGTEGLPLHWAIRPTLGPDAASLTIEARDGVCSARNAESFLPGAVLRVCGSTGSARTDFSPPAVLWQCVGGEETILVCGCGEIDALKSLCSPEGVQNALAKTREDWARRCAAVRLSTGSADMDRYLNDWAVYQTLCCRLLARSSLYQSGGAYGFRDQLQDAVNLLPLSPEHARQRILDACRHQYAEGDVMHWWHPHPDGDRGLRSRCADDLLWLPWALCEYTEVTGDYGFALRREPWLHSPALASDERDRYETLMPDGKAQSVLKHAKAAVDRCVRRGWGAHGLPLFGGGDWNDGFDAVDGESVWLGFFLAYVSGRLAALLRRMKDTDAERYRTLSAEMLAAAEASWNGHFYRRGFWADGTTLGGEERIDLLPQAWAAFCGAAHADEALDAALASLVDKEHDLVRLFVPPFTDSERSPGYISSYGPGVRENGGQYTHGAVWLALALAERGRREEAAGILHMLLPTAHDALRYEAEPFVLAADLSAAPGFEGRAGWTWYTGSAGWYLRAARKCFPPLPKSD
jgi:cyclic beta-1,2-glucan synthetase